MTNVMQRYQIVARKSFGFPRDIDDLILALDDHMVILRAAILRSREEPSFIKIVASELRVLVCLASGTEGLLWRICEKLQICDFVQVVNLGEVDPDHPLARGLEFQVSPIRRPIENEIGVEISLKELIKSHQAIYVASIKSERITHEKLFRLISEQIGGAHEDDKVSPELEKLKSFLLNGQRFFDHVLAIDSELVLQVAERVIREAEKTYNYKRTKITKESGDLTIVMKTNHLNHLLGSLDLFSIGCELNELSFVFCGSPAGLKIQIYQYCSMVEDVSIPVDEIPCVASIAISYSSRLGQIRILNGCKEILRKTCNLGWVDTGFFSAPQFVFPIEGFINIEGVLLYQRLLSRSEVAEFRNTSIREFHEQIQNSGQDPDFPD